MVTYPQGWETYRVIDVADLFDNLRIPVTKNQRRPGNTPYYGANGIQDYVDGYTHDGEFVLIAEDGANDLLNYPVTYAKGKIWVNNHAHVISAKESVAVTKFLYYLLKKVDYTTFLVGGTRAKLNGKTFKNIEITIPSNTSEQKAISSILSDLDNHIDNLGKLIEKKKNIRDGALEDLISGRTRLDGFHDDWEEKTLKELCYLITKQTGFDYSAEIKPSLVQNKKEGVLPFIQNKDFEKRFINYNTDFYIPKDIADKYPKILLNEVCLLISISGRIGNVGVFNNRHPAFAGGAVGIAKLIDPSLAEWCMYFLISERGQEQIFKHEKVGAQHNLTIEDVRNLKIQIPSVKERESIINILKCMDDEIEALEAERDKMIQIREGAMDDLLTGRVRLTV